MSGLRDGAGVYVSYPDWETTRIRAFLRLFKSHGGAWVAVQTHNGGSQLADGVVWRWIDACRLEGVAFGLWGVVYTEPEQAAVLHAEHIRRYRPKIAIINAEAHFQGNPWLGGDETVRWDRNLRYLRTFDAQTMPAEVPALALSTLGAASGENVYWMPHSEWMKRHDVHAQAYFNAWDDYRPDRCVQHWLRASWPIEKIKLTLGCYRGEAGSKALDLRLADYLPWLLPLPIKGVHLYQAESLVDDDLRNVTKLVEHRLVELPAPPPPPPLPVFDVSGARAKAIGEMKATVDYWRAVGSPLEDGIQIQRQTLAWRVLHLVQSGTNLRAVRDLLDELGAPKP